MRNCDMSPEELTEIFGSQCLIGNAKFFDELEPVLYPGSPAELAELMRVAAEHEIAIIPVGSGTTIHKLLTQKTARAVGISTRKLDRILSVQRETMVCKVQAGIFIEDLLGEIRKLGMFLPVNGLNLRQRTIGGLISEDAAGWERSFYGSLYNQVLGMEVILPTGELINIGGQTLKNVSGLETGCLFAGSYGTLGIITSLTFRLRPLPEKQSICLIHGPSVRETLTALQRIRLNRFIRPASMHLLFNIFAPADLNLLISFAGSKRAVDENLSVVESILSEYRLQTFAGENEVKDIWQEICDRHTQFLDKNTTVSIEFNNGRLEDVLNLFNSFLAEQFVLDLGTGTGYIGVDCFVASDLSEKRKKFRGLCNIKLFQSSNGFGMIKNAVDPKKSMFPNCRLLRG